MTTVFCYSGKESDPTYIGLAYTDQRRGRLASTFAYSHEYLSLVNAFAIDPELPLQAGNWPVSYELPGCFFDSTPDQWGRNLINKRYPGRRLDSLDYLLSASDISRQGALRFKIETNDKFQFPDTKVPKLMSLQELYYASESIDDPRASKEAVQYLLEAGSGSLGGARPKAVVDKDGQLFLAKFPHRYDKTDIIAAEYQALRKAQTLGMNVPIRKRVAGACRHCLMLTQIQIGRS
ncbi:MAG: HipA N-terminal domain-containing protein [Coriobacteriales bacterium]|jgi:serine/threonine-protein kinase HipA|nr:HipA N-terminal domain-containing protein [Coriobacteriales bacterium]